MPLPLWEVKRVSLKVMEAGGSLPGKRAYIARCPRCKAWVILALSWRRRNKWGTAPCPTCFKTNRIPKREDIDG